MTAIQSSALSLIQKAGCALIGSVDSDGFPGIKAMLKPRKQDGLSCFYFTTNTSSQRVAQFRENPKSSLYFFDPRSFQGLLLTGTIEVLEDQPSKDLIWRDGDDLYYPKGVTDPDYCVLRFTASQGRFYENFHSTSFPVRDDSDR